MGRRRRHTPEQIIRKLREADRLLGEGQDVGQVAKQLEVSEQTLHRWRLQYGGLKADDAKRLKELVKENQRLKRIVSVGFEEPLVVEPVDPFEGGGRCPRKRVKVNFLAGRLHSPAIVVCLGLPRTTPRRPSSRISRATVQRATRTPSRFSCAHTLSTP